jgi:hypothetical protein
MVAYRQGRDVACRVGKLRALAASAWRELHRIAHGRLVLSICLVCLSVLGIACPSVDDAAGVRPIAGVEGGGWTPTGQIHVHTYFSPGEKRDFSQRDKPTRVAAASSPPSLLFYLDIFRTSLTVAASREAIGASYPARIHGGEPRVWWASEFLRASAQEDDGSLHRPPPPSS